MPIIRVTTFVAGTPILSAEMNAELDQLVELLSGIDTSTGIEVAINDAGLSPIVANQVNAAGPIMEGQKNGTTAFFVDDEGQAKVATNSAFSEFGAALCCMDSNAIEVSDAGGIETNLYARSIAANTFTVNGDYVRVKAGGTIAAVPTAKLIRVYFGPSGSETEVFDSTDFAADLTGIAWDLDVWLVRTDTNIVRVLTTLRTSNGVGAGTAIIAVSPLTLTNAQNFKITADGSASVSVTKMFAIMEKGNER